jgi:peptide/nickel transport system permease protein
MARILWRVAQALAVGLVCTIVVFLLVRIVPGSPARGILGVKANAQEVAALTAQLHLNLPLWEQFTSYFGGLLRGDLGNSLINPSRTVIGIVTSSLPITLSLVLVSIIISTIAGTAIGLVAALSERRLIDIGVRAMSSTLLSLPPFLTALALILFLALDAHWFPATGWGTGWVNDLPYLVLPALALSGYLGPFIARAVRQAALDVSGQHYIDAAIGRGIPRRTLVLRHILPNCLLPVVTLIGLNMGSLIAGAVVVEALFAIPGIGWQLVNAVQLRDYPVIQGIALVLALFVVVINMLTDITYLLIDPRTRNPRTASS